MTRPGVTYTEVANAAQQLIASGQEPTIERCRVQLQTGSNSTIGMHLRKWRTQQDSLQQLVSVERIPEELIGLLKGLWERVMGQAQAQIHQVKVEFQQELAQQQHTIQHLQQGNARLQQSEAVHKQSCEGLAQEKMTLEQIVIKTNTAMATLQAQYDGVLQQLAEKQIHADELRKQNQQTQANLEHYRAASLEQRQSDQQRAEQQQRELAQTIQQLKLENEALKQQKINWKHLHNKLQFAQKSMEAELAKVTEQAETTSAELIETHKVLAQTTQSQQHWKIQHDEIVAKGENDLKIIAELQTQHAVLSQQLITATTDLAHVTDQNQILSHDKWILGQEKAQLWGQVKQLESIMTRNQ